MSPFSFMFRIKSARMASLVLLALAANPGCELPGRSTSEPSTPPTSLALSEPQIVLSTQPATTLQCPTGGLQIFSFRDQNSNGVFDSSEVTLTSNVICNGLQGAQGLQGISAGIQITAAPLASCPAGGQSMTTFLDLNSNGTRESNETLTSISTICNGTTGATGASGATGATGSTGATGATGATGSTGADGRDGKSSFITTSLASTQQCPAGGIAYTVTNEGQVPVITPICHGVNGSDGTNGSNATWYSGAVGEPITGKTYSSCHHDYIYLPGSATSRGWLVFRHQGNGANDQGIGSTGFQIWNVDIADFALASEVGNVAYCSLHWDPTAKKLRYTVVDSTDGQAGASGSIQF